MTEIRAKNPKPETQREPPSDPRKPAETPQGETYPPSKPPKPGDKK